MKNRTHTVYFNGTYPGRFADFVSKIEDARAMTYQEAVNFANRVRAAGGTAQVVPIGKGN